MAAVTQARSRLLGLKSNSCFRRGFALDNHGPTRVNIWEAPGSPSKWKEEHFVFASLAGWGAIFFGGYKAATGGSKKREGPAPAAKPPAATEKPKRESKLPPYSARPEHKPAAVVAPAKKPEPKTPTKPESRKKEARKEPEGSVKQPYEKEGPKAKKIPSSKKDHGKQKED